MRGGLSSLDIEIGRGLGGAAPVTSQLPRCTNHHASRSQSSARAMIS